MSSNFKEWITCFNLPPSPIIHAGAHYAEERDEYRDSFFEPVFWIEALPDVAELCSINLVSYKNQKIIEAAISNEPGIETLFYIAGTEHSSSSMLKPHLIEASHPEVTLTREISVVTTTLDKLYKENTFGDYDNYGLVLDLQGAEIRAIEGASVLLDKVSFIISEVSTRNLYKGGARFKELSRMLDKSGFSLLASEVNRATGWGEALYINRNSQISHILASTTKKQIVVGNYSLGTAIRSILVKARAPHVLINLARRK